MAICPECGSVLPDGKRFCSNCGAKVDAAVVRAAPARSPKPADNGRVVKPSRAQTQGRPVQPFDEKRPLAHEVGQGKRADPRTEDLDRIPTERQEPRVRPFDQCQMEGDGQRQREPQERRIVREMPPLFDDDEFYEQKKPIRSIGQEEQGQRQTKQEKPRGRAPIPVLRTQECLLAILLAILPVVGLVVGILWAKNPTNPNRRNLSIAMAVFNIAELVLGIIGFVLFEFVFVA